MDRLERTLPAQAAGYLKAKQRPQTQDKDSRRRVVAAEVIGDSLRDSR